MAAHAHSVKGELAAHTTRLECLEAQLQEAGLFLEALPQSRQEFGAALAKMQQRKLAEQAKCDVKIHSRLVKIEIGGLLCGDAVALAELRTHAAVIHVTRAEVESLREAVLGVRDGLLGRSDALGAEVTALRAEQEVSHESLQQLGAAAECKVNASTAEVEAQSAEVGTLLDAVQERVGTRCDLDDLEELRTRDACDMGQVRKAWQLKLLPRQHHMEVSRAALLAIQEKMQQAPSRAEVESLAAQAAQLMRSLEALEGALLLKAEEKRVQMAVRALELGNHRLQKGLPSKAGAKEVAEKHRRLLVKARLALGMLGERGTQLSTTVDVVKGGLETAEWRVATKPEGAALHHMIVAHREMHVQVKELSNKVASVASHAQDVVSGETASSLNSAAQHAVAGAKPKCCVIPSSWAAVRETEAEERTAAATAGPEARAAAAARRAGLISRIEELEAGLLQIRLSLRRADHHRKRDQEGRLNESDTGTKGLPRAAPSSGWVQLGPHPDQVAVVSIYPSRPCDVHAMRMRYAHGILTICASRMLSTHALHRRALRRSPNV